jgi:hypothetical protein
MISPRNRNLAVIEATMKAEHDKAGREQETMIMRHNLILHLQEENRRLHALNDELLATLKHIREKDPVPTLSGGDNQGEKSQ